MNTRILFTDLDGTLLNDKKEITEYNQSILDATLAQGHKVVVSTGRSLPSAMLQVQRLSLNKPGCYAITYNGALIYDLYRKTILYSNPLPLEIVKPLFMAAYNNGIHIQTYSQTHILSEKETSELLTYSRINELPYQIIPDISLSLDAKPYKLIAITESDISKIRHFQEMIQQKYDGIIDTFFSSDTYMEIVKYGVSKGMAVKWLCDYLNIPLENSVAAGDAENDISMLQTAHVGAVMCNANPSIYPYGNYITKSDNNHDGVAEIVRRFILN